MTSASRRELVAFVETAVREEYLQRVSSQKRAVLQRLSKASPAALPELWALVDDISCRSHALYTSGAELLLRLERERDGTAPAASLRFVTVLDALLQDVVQFDLMMSHWRGATSEGDGASLSADTMRAYSHAALVAASLTAGGLVDDVLSDLKWDG